MAGHSGLSRTTRDRLANDDLEIARLEKKLGIKKKGSKTPSHKAPRAERELSGGLDDLVDLDDLLGDLGGGSGSDSDSRKRKHDDATWLKTKRRKVEVEVESDFDGFSDSASETPSSAAAAAAAVEDDVESEAPNKPATIPRVRENPYVAPSAGKYIPPSLRRSLASDDDEVATARLRRQIQGQINRLSESNLLSILSAIDKLYQDHARQHVTTASIDILLALIADAAALTDTFIVLHAGFVAAMYTTIGVDFGAQFLETAIQRLDSHAHGKRAANLVSLLSALYNFEVISCHIIYDLVRQFVADFNEDNTELILRLIRTCGPQLRKDDPSALKDVITLVQSKAKTLGDRLLSVRQKFMIDTMNDLRNNRLRVGMGSSASGSEFMTNMKKTLGTVKATSTKASEPLRLTLSDIRDSEKKGKWWLVGASYHDPAKMANAKPELSSSNGTKSVAFAKDDSLSLIARSLGFNTDIRRAIFMIMMSSSDYKEAVIRIKKLNLKKAQLEEIANVIHRCVTGEDTYNRYYAVLAREFCYERSIKWALQTALWDNLKLMDASTERDDNGHSDQDDQLDAKTIVSLAKFYGALVRQDAISITVLKTLDWTYIQPRTGMFLEILLTTIILDKSKISQGRTVEDILCDIKNVPDIVTGFVFLLEAAVIKSKVPEKSRHKNRVAEVCRAVIARLSSADVEA